MTSEIEVDAILWVLELGLMQAELLCAAQALLQLRTLAWALSSPI
jgi:hypothetical protein